MSLKWSEENVSYLQTENRSMRIGVVGVTGLVGTTLLTVLEERKFPVSEIVGAASEASADRHFAFRGEKHPVVSVEALLQREPDLVFFCAGAEESKFWIPQFVERKIWVIDNSSAWRMEEKVPLIVPEVNASLCQNYYGYLIANPNCSTIQLVCVLAPLHKKYHLEKVVVSTYQAVTGSGKKAVNQLFHERENLTPPESAYPYPIDLNCIPQCDVFVQNGYTREEWKIMMETRKILNLPLLNITATAVRVPVIGGHSESVWVAFEKHPASIEEIRSLLRQAPGVQVIDDPENNQYPMPLTVNGKDQVFVGRIRYDLFQPNAIHLWIVADNLRKGAATNAVQIAEWLVQHHPAFQEKTLHR